MHATSQHVLQQHLPHLQNGHSTLPHHIPQHNGIHQSPPVQQQLQLQPIQNQHATHHLHPPSQRSTASSTSKEPTRVVGIPAAVISGDRFVYGDAQSTSERSYTPIKSVGDGSFGTVWLVDWHTKLPPNTPLSAMQCGAGAKPDWAGKRLVALKQMKKRGEGGWDECKKLKELEVRRHYLSGRKTELYFAFEPMEGNLYQLIKSRRGRPLAGGLVSCIFRQVVSGLHHIHANGYFHRDMKPENLLVTTTGLFDYRSVSPIAQPNAPPERDVVVIVKLADFGLARETKSKPPYTEYVSTRWYRAPEVLLRSRDYSNPVDMWALGTIMAELVNLKPLFPGSTEIDQVARICEILGDPSDQYGVDARGAYIGGGKWVRGIKMARSVGYQFPKLKPVAIQQLFDRAVPLSIVQCISDLLKYDPDVRLTSKQCLEHPYIMDTMHGNIPPGPQVPFTINTLSPQVKPMPSMNTITPRTCPPSHSQSPASGKPIFNANPQSHRKPFLPQNGEQGAEVSSDGAEPMQIQTDSLLPPNPNVDAMDISPISPQMGSQQYNEPQPMEVIITSPGVESSKRIVSQSQVSPSIAAPVMQPSASGSKYSFLKPGRLGGFGRMFGHGEKGQQHGLPPVDELNVASSSSSPSLKRTQTGSTDSVPRSEISSIGESFNPEPPAPMDAKARKKEAERVALEAEKVRRVMAEKRSRDQARAVLQKRNMLAKQRHGTDLDWDSANAASTLGVQKPKPKSRTGMGAQGSHSSATINAAGGRFRSPVEGKDVDGDSAREAEYRTKARRRDLDDDHSMSSADIPNGRVSVMSFATVESDPISSRIRHRPSLFGISRMQSASSLRTSFGDEFSLSGHSASSPSFDHQIGSDYDSRASMSSYDPTRSSISEINTPLPMQSLSISSPQQQAQMLHRQPYITLPPVHSMSHQPFRSPTPGSPYEYGSFCQISGQPPSPAIAPHSAINPIFKVAPPQAGDASDSPYSSLPPFSELASIAEPLPLGQSEHS